MLWGSGAPAPLPAGFARRLPARPAAGPACAPGAAQRRQLPPGMQESRASCSPDCSGGRICY